MGKYSWRGIDVDAQGRVQLVKKCPTKRPANFIESDLGLGKSKVDLVNPILLESESCRRGYSHNSKSCFRGLAEPDIKGIGFIMRKTRSSLESDSDQSIYITSHENCL